MRFDARHIGSGVWGIFDTGVMGWRVTDLAEHEAHQQAADLNVTFNQYGQRDQADRIEVNPPIEVNSATWSAAGQLDWWVKERREWWGRVRGPDGRQAWIKASDLRPAKKGLYPGPVTISHRWQPPRPLPEQAERVDDRALRTNVRPILDGEKRHAPCGKSVLARSPKDTANGTLLIAERCQANAEPSLRRRAPE